MNTEGPSRSLWAVTTQHYPNGFLETTRSLSSGTGADFPVSCGYAFSSRGWWYLSPPCYMWFLSELGRNASSVDVLPFPSLREGSSAPSLVSQHCRLSCSLFMRWPVFLTCWVWWNHIPFLGMSTPSSEVRRLSTTSSLWITTHWTLEMPQSADSLWTVVVCPPKYKNIKL